MLSKKVGLLFVTILVGMGLVVPAALGQVTLRFWPTQFDIPQAEAIQKSCDEFEALNPGVKIKWTGTEMGDLETKIPVVLAANKEPDISVVGHGAFTFLLQEDMLVSLDDVTERLGGKINFSKPALNQVTSEGKIWGIVVDQWIANVVYRRDWLEEAGYSYDFHPRSREMFLEVVKKMTTANRYGYVFAMGSGMEELNLYPFMAAGRAYEVNPYSGKPDFDTPATIEVLKFMKELLSYCPPGQVNYGWDEEMNAFLTGKAWAVTTLASEVIYFADERELKWANHIASMAPPGPVLATAGWYNPVVIFSTSKHIDIAKDFLAYYCSVEPYTRLITSFPMIYPTAYLPANEADILKTMPLVKKYPWIYEQSSAVLPYALQVGSESGPILWSARVDHRQVFGELYKDVFLEQIPIEEAVAKVQKALEKAYEEREK